MLSKAKSSWLKLGILNTLEHGLTRGGDALMSLVLLWVLSPDSFSHLALAQALVAPLLLFFISPVFPLYREYSKWKDEGPAHLAARLYALRVLGVGLGQFALFLGIITAWLCSSQFGQTYYDRLSAILWAFGLSMGGHLSAVDRELLRIELKLKELNFITLFQKLSVLVGTAIVAFFIHARVDLLAAVVAASMIITAVIARFVANQILVTHGRTPPSLDGKRGPTVIETLSYVLKDFSLWNHLSGVLLNWVQTMDVFFLGVLRFSSQEIGLYAFALKISNLSFAIPNALGSLFMVWVGRRTPDGMASEKRELWKLTFYLTLGAVAQAALLIALAPWLISLMSHGRWSQPEQDSIISWLRWITGGGVFVCSTFLLNSWASLRMSVSKLFYRVYLPLTMFSIAVYCGSAYWGGPGAVAIANVPVGLVYLGLILHTTAFAFE